MLLSTQGVAESGSAIGALRNVSTWKDKLPCSAVCRADSMQAVAVKEGVKVSCQCCQQEGKQRVTNQVGKRDQSSRFFESRFKKMTHAEHPRREGSLCGDPCFVVPVMNHLACDPGNASIDHLHCFTAAGAGVVEVVDFCAEALFDDVSQACNATGNGPLPVINF